MEAPQVSPERRMPEDDRPSMAVLPFTSLDEAKSGHYFSDGVTEDIILELSRYRELLVIGRTSSFGYESASGDTNHIARELGVRYLLHGSIRRAGDRVRISSQLIDASVGDQIWADRQDGTIDNLLDLQAEIASRIAGSIVPEIEQAERRRAEHRPIANAAAYDLALRAGAQIERGISPPDAELLSAGIRLAQKAIEIDPLCRRAHYALAWGYCRRGVIGGIRADRAADLDAADAAAMRLRELDPSDHSAYAVLGHIAMRRLQHDEAIGNLRRAHDLNPSDTTTLRWLSWEESNLGLVDEARQHAELSLRVGPRDRSIDLSYWALALADYVDGDCQGCIRNVKRAMALNRQFSGHQILLAACLAESGQLAEAGAVMTHLAQNEPDLLRSRLAGRTYFAAPELAARYLRALRAAAEAGSVATLGSEAAASASPHPLTGREQQVLRLVAQGLSNPQIATELGLSEHTVKRHVANVLLKLALPTRAAAVAVAARLGLLFSSAVPLLLF